MGLDNFDIDQLREEIIRRENLLRAGLCWYCGVKFEVHTCKLAPADQRAAGQRKHIKVVKDHQDGR